MHAGINGYKSLMDLWNTEEKGMERVRELVIRTIQIEEIEDG